MMKTEAIPNHTSELIKKYLALLDELYKLASSTETSSKVLEKLSSLSDSYILTAIALNPNTPAKVLNKLYNHHPGIGGTDEEMRIHIICNAALPAKYLKQFAETDESEVVRKVAIRALELADLG